MTKNRDTFGMTEMLFHKASSHQLTLPQAVFQLRQNARTRTLKESLARCCGMEGKDDAALKKGVVQLLMQGNPEANPDSMDRKVRLWMNDSAQYIEKKAAIQLAYSLKLSAEDADQLLVRLAGEHLHWRDAKDIIWGYGLNNGLTFSQACALQDRLLGKGDGSKKQGADDRTKTILIKTEAMCLKEEKELEQFLKDNREKLGKLHNTAYDIFTNFMNLLSQPDMRDFLPEARVMSVREIVSTYLYKKYIPKASDLDKKDTGIASPALSAIQRDIRQNWPDETTLSRMAHRETDVTRKVLILLFLACDGGESEYGEMEDDTDEDDVFQAMYSRMNAMLNDCGFIPLDSRTPFDWMVLYCMCADDSIFVDENIQRFLSAIFADGSVVSDDDE